MTFQKKVPGVLFCTILALPAWFLGEKFPLVGAPVFAILLGMIIGNFHTNREQTVEGLPSLQNTFCKSPLCFWDLVLT